MVRAMRALIASLSLALACAFGSACGGDDAGGGGDGGDGDAAPELIDIPIDLQRALDVLFVVDDSATMSQEQAALASGFPAFVQALTDTDEPVDLHIGFVSSNVGTGPEGAGGVSCTGDGDAGHLLLSASCPALTDDARYLAHRVAADGEAEVNYTGDLASQLECEAGLGTSGCGFEQHLESMRRALENDVENAGFLRDQANLAVIVLADEDDCSASDRGLFAAQPGGDTRSSPLGELTSFRCFEFGITCQGDEDERALGPRQGCVPDDASDYVEPVATYADFLTELKGGAHRIAFAAITAGSQPVAVGIEENEDRLWVEPQCVVCPDGSPAGCPIESGTADDALVAAAPAIRLHTLADRFASRSQVEDICAWRAAAHAVDYRPALGRIGERLRVDGGSRCLARAPADRDPAVDGVQPLCEVLEGEVTIPSCGELSAPCWYLAHAAECADSETALVIDRGDSSAATGAVAIRCAD